jgi:hypothetical protein
MKHQAEPQIHKESHTPRCCHLQRVPSSSVMGSMRVRVAVVALVVKGTPSKKKGPPSAGSPARRGVGCHMRAWAPLQGPRPLTLGTLPSASFKLPIANADPSHPAALPERAPGQPEAGAGPLRARVRPCEAQGPSNLKSVQPNLGQIELRL